MVELYYEPLGIIEELSCDGESEMSPWQAAFLCGLIKAERPKKILEIGVSAGGTTAIILKCLSLLSCEGKCISVDINDKYYRNPSLKVGFMAEESKKLFHNVTNHEIKIGIIPDLIDDIGFGIDFLILDTVHMLPGEILDFLVCLPYLKENATVVLHDVILHMFCPSIYNYATQVLLDCVTGDKYPVYGPDNEYNYPNIAAFKINNDTKKYICDVFSSLLLTWQYDLPSQQSASYRKKYAEIGYSRECLRIFDCAVQMNKGARQRRLSQRIAAIEMIVEQTNKLRGKQVYIYGAGEVGKMFRKAFDKTFVFMGYIVSDDQEAENDVRTLSSVESEIEENALIYVAVAPDKMSAIRANIEGRKIKNQVIYMDLVLFEYFYKV